MALDFAPLPAYGVRYRPAAKLSFYVEKGYVAPPRAERREEEPRVKYLNEYAGDPRYTDDWPIIWRRDQRFRERIMDSQVAGATAINLDMFMAPPYVCFWQVRIYGLNSWGGTVARRPAVSISTDGATYPTTVTTYTMNMTYQYSNPTQGPPASGVAAWYNTGSDSSSRAVMFSAFTGNASIDESYNAILDVQYVGAKGQHLIATRSSKYHYTSAYYISMDCHGHGYKGVNATAPPQYNGQPIRLRIHFLDDATGGTIGLGITNGVYMKGGFVLVARYAFNA